MKKIKHILNYKNFIVATSLVTAIILSLFLISPVIADIKQDMDMHANCTKTIFPDNVEQDIVVDSDIGVIYVEYAENGVTKKTVFSLKEDPKFSECTDSAKELITLAQDNTNKLDADTCKEFIEIASGRQILPVLDDGKEMDIRKLENYINKHCK